MRNILIFQISRYLNLMKSFIFMNMKSYVLIQMFLFRVFVMSIISRFLRSIRASFAANVFQSMLLGTSSLDVLHTTNLINDLFT